MGDIAVIPSGDPEVTHANAFALAPNGTVNFATTGQLLDVGSRTATVSAFSLSALVSQPGCATAAPRNLQGRS